MKKLFALFLSGAMLCCLGSCAAEPASPSDVSDVSSEEEEMKTQKLPWKDVDGDGVIRVACVGDSITAGSEPITYPNYLQEYLDFLSQTDGVKYEVKNHGKGGAAVRDEPENVGKRFYYDDNLYKSSLTYTPDVVIVQMGTNDGAFENLANADSYFKNDYYTYFIKPYVDKGCFLVLATPPHASNGIHDDGVNGKISALVRELAEEYHLPLIDVNKLTEGRDESFPDGLHGNTSGYSLLAQIYYNQIFGGELWHIKFKTEPHARIYFDIHMATADENGDAALTMPDYGASRNFALKITCADRKNITDTAIVNDDVTLTYPMKDGQHDVTGHATATAESVYANGGNTPDKTLDGSLDTRWESNYRNNSWLLVDLGEVKEIGAVNIWWEGAYASEYAIEVSEDGTDYREVASVNLTHEGEEITSFDPVNARFVRVKCIKRATIFGFSIKEIRILSA